MRNTLPDKGQRPVVAFEVLVKQHNGQWQGRGNFAASERELAIDAARALEQDRTVALVKVVKETYDPATHATEETTVYRFSAAPAADGDTLQARRARAKAREDAERARVPSQRRRTAMTASLARLPALLRALAAGCGRVARRRHYPAAMATAAPANGTAPTLAANTPPPACAWVQQRRIVMEFLRDVAGQVADLGTGADNDTRLGLCFYICGACAATIERQPLAEDDAAGFVAECLAVLRLPRRRALQFAADREIHVAESPRFKTMFRIGHGAMSAYLRTSASTSADGLQRALRSWSAGAPQASRTRSRNVTIVLTEILHEPATTREASDDRAARYRRVHDRIVDSVLRQFRGVQAGQAPRGMVAAFQNPASAIKCAVLIQRCIEEQNAGALERPVTLRIAVVDHAADTDSAAAPTAAVELARTMIVAAQPGGIVCTAPVRRAAEAMNLPCASREPIPMPDRPEPMPWYEIVAGDAAPAAGAAARASGRAAVPPAAT